MSRMLGEVSAPAPASLECQWWVPESPDPHPGVCSPAVGWGSTSQVSSVSASSQAVHAVLGHWLADTAQKLATGRKPGSLCAHLLCFRSQDAALLCLLSSVWNLICGSLRGKTKFFTSDSTMIRWPEAKVYALTSLSNWYILKKRSFISSVAQFIF